jgi:hypothetical protein
MKYNKNCCENLVSLIADVLGYNMNVIYKKM